MAKRGYLLVNLGTPKDPSPGAVGRYLREFLSDPLVIDIPAPLRWALVHLIIVPFRSRKSAHLYRNIWTDRGSPLLFHSQDLVKKVKSFLRQGEVELAMRYGEPSMAQGIQALKDKGVEQVVMLPLYPQFAQASFASTIAEAKRLKRKFQGLSLSYLKEFYDQDFYIDVLTASIQEVLDREKPDFLLFSYHGVPEHQVAATGEGCEFNDTCCATFRSHNPKCYRAHCLQTTELTKKKLNLAGIGTAMTFQSRLGNRPWLKPYTDEYVKLLPAKGIKKLAVACPAFTADCLETLEEISLRLSEDFQEAGGEKVILIPSLNSRDDWSQAVASYCHSSQPLPL